MLPNVNNLDIIHKKIHIILCKRMVMATLYDKNEIYTATEMVRNFSSILKKIISKEKKRAVIVKNNKFEAVLLRIDEYEKFKDAYDILQKLYQNDMIKHK